MSMESPYPYLYGPHWSTSASRNQENPMARMRVSLTLASLHVILSGAKACPELVEGNLSPSGCTAPRYFRR
jgi:hypothetical protein